MNGGRTVTLASLALVVLLAAVGQAAAPLDDLGSKIPLGTGTSSAPLKAPDLPSVPTTSAPLGAAAKGTDLVASLLGALGAVGGALGSLAGGVARVAGALFDGFAWLVGAIIGSLTWLANGFLRGTLAVGGALGAALGKLLDVAVLGLTVLAGSLGTVLGALAAGLASALGVLAGLFARGAGGAAEAVRRDPRVLVPVGGVAAAGALAWWAKAGKLAPIAALFSRLERHELLNNDARQRIFDLVKERPGAHLSEIAETMGLGWGTTVYHLNRLREGQLLTARKVGNQLCHFVNGEGRSAQEQTLLAATKAPKAQAIVDYIALRGPSSQSTVAQELGMSGALVSWHAKKLEDLGVLSRVRQGRNSVLVLSQPMPARPVASARSVVPPRAPALQAMPRSATAKVVTARAVRVASPVVAAAAVAAPASTPAVAMRPPDPGPRAPQEPFPLAA